MEDKTESQRGNFPHFILVIFPNTFVVYGWFWSPLQWFHVHLQKSACQRNMVPDKFLRASEKISQSLADRNEQHSETDKLTETKGCASHHDIIVVLEIRTNSATTAFLWFERNKELVRNKVAKELSGKNSIPHKYFLFSVEEIAFALINAMTNSIMKC